MSPAEENAVRTSARNGWSSPQASSSHRARSSTGKSIAF